MKRDKRPWRTFGANYIFSHVKSRDKNFSPKFQAKRATFGFWRPIIVRLGFGRTKRTVCMERWKRSLNLQIVRLLQCLLLHRALTTLCTTRKL